MDELGPFGHVVNVVGGNLAEDYQRTVDFDLAALDRVMARNLRYAVVSCREVARSLIARGEPGSMVNVSSLASRGTPLLAAYAAAKSGLESFSRTMALEWGPRGIRVNLVSLGMIRTPRTGMEAAREDVAGSVPLRRKGSPDEVAAAVMFLLSERAELHNRSHTERGRRDRTRQPWRRLALPLRDPGRCPGPVRGTDR